MGDSNTEDSGREKGNEKDSVSGDGELGGCNKVDGDVDAEGWGKG